MTAPYVDPQNVGNKPGDGPLRQGGVPASAIPLTQQNLPSTESKAVERMKHALTLVRDLAAGPERVRDAGTTYLPIHPAEDPKNYAVRLARSVFFNALGQTIKGLTGMVFRRDPILGEDVPESIVEQWENIDNAGTHGDVFVRERLQDILTAGHGAILVEFPQTESLDAPRINGKLDREVEQTLNIRPYWVPILKDHIVSWRTTVEFGATILTQLVVKECQTVPDGDYGERERTRYRVFYREGGVVGFRLLEITENRTVLLVDQGTYPTQDEIPVAELVTSGKKSMFESDPPLIDLAYLNVAHYQQWSDYAYAIHLTNVPFLFTAGVQMLDEQGAAIKIGPNTTVSAPNPDAKAEYVSHDGAALTTSKASLDDIKGDMATLGLQMLAPDKRAAETATAKRIDKKASDSALSVTARGLQDGVERALHFHAKYLNLDSGGSIQINRDFENLALDPQMIQALSGMVKDNQLSLETLWAKLAEGNVLPDAFNPDDEAAKIEGERKIQEALHPAPQPITGQPAPVPVAA